MEKVNSSFLLKNFCTEVQGDILTGPSVPCEVYHLPITHSQRTATTPGASRPSEVLGIFLRQVKRSLCYFGMGILADNLWTNGDLMAV